MSKTAIQPSDDVKTIGPLIPGDDTKPSANNVDITANNVSSGSINTLVFNGAADKQIKHPDQIKKEKREKKDSKLTKEEREEKKKKKAAKKQKRRDKKALRKSQREANKVAAESSSNSDSDSDSDFFEPAEPDKLACCCCIPMGRAPTLLMVMATLEIFYLLYNTLWGLIFFSVARASQTGVSANGQLEAGATATTYNKKIADEANKYLTSDPGYGVASLSLDQDQAVRFGFWVGGMSAFSLVIHFYMFFLFCKHRACEELLQREGYVTALTIWVVKTLLWYAVVCITFLVIMLDQSGTEFIKQIALGVVQFTVLFWWRTTFSDLLDELVPKEEVEDERAARALDMERRKRDLERRIAKREEQASD